jgi:hypothetical protein
VSHTGIQNAAKSIIQVVGVAHLAAYRVELQVFSAIGVALFFISYGA